MTMIALATPRPRVSVDRAAPFLWYTLSVRGPSEQWVCARAKELEIETYVPMKREPTVPNPRFPNRSREPVTRPLMPGYVFVALETENPRFDVFAPDTDAGYASNRLRDTVGPIWGCRGLLRSQEGPMPVHEAVIEDMRLRERNGEFDLTAKTDSGRGFVARWVKVGAWVQLVAGPFWGYFGVIEEVMSPTLVKVGVTVFGRTTSMTLLLDWIRIAVSEDHGVLISQKNHSMRPSWARNG